MSDKERNHPRNILFSWMQFQLLCEVLNGYTSPQELKPDKAKVKDLLGYLVEQWKKDAHRG